MIRAAGIGIAIGNAMPEVKKAADYVAKAIDDGGLALGGMGSVLRKREWL